MAELLGQQAMQPVEMPQQPGVKFSPYAGLAKMLQGYTSGMMQRKALEQQKELQNKIGTEATQDYSKLLEAMRPQPAIAERPQQLDVQEQQQMADQGSPMPPNMPAQAAKEFGLAPNFDMRQFKNPDIAKMAMAQQLTQLQSQAELERKKNEPRVLSAGQGVYAPDGRVIIQAPFAPKERTGNLGVYDEYVKQQNALGKLPLPIDQFINEQAKAGRAPAAITYGSPVAAVGADGKPVFIQPGKGGGAPSVIEGFTPPAEKLRPIPPSINTAIIENQTSGNQIDRAIALLSGQDLPGMTGDKNATGLKAYLPTGLLNRVDPSGVNARAEIADIGSLKIHDRSGAAVTASESPRLMPFIPLATDDRDTALKKLQRLKLEIDNSSAAMKEIYSTEQGYRENPILNKPSVGGKITSMQEIQEVATKTGKSVEQVKQDALAKGYKVQ
jgi:hypothetical protein